MKTLVDPAHEWRVGSGMHRIGTGLLALCLGIAACGGSSKKAGTTAAAGGGAGGAVDASGQPAGGGSDPADPDTSESFAPGEAPPGLDLSPEEKKQKAGEHLAKARKALAPQGRDPAEAIEETKLALSVDETNVEAMVLLAHANYLKGYYDLAEEVLEKAQKRGGTGDKKLWFLLGLVYQKTDREDQAFAAFDKSVSIDPDYKPAMLNLGVYYLKNKRYEQAIKLYERLTGDLGFKRAVAWVNLGTAYRGRAAEVQGGDAGRRNELILKAESTYKRAMGVDRDYAPAYYNIGLLYLDSDPYPAGKGDLDRLKRLKTAKDYFNQYRRLPGAVQKLADDQTEVADKLYAKEEKVREKERKLKALEEKTKAMEDKAKKLEESGGDKGFE